MMIVTEPSSQHSLLSAGEAAMESCPVEGSLGGALHSGHDLKEYCKKKKKSACEIFINKSHVVCEQNK